MSGKHVVKSGSDFKHLSVVRLELELAEPGSCVWECGQGSRPRSDTMTSEDYGCCGGSFGRGFGSSSLCTEVFGELAYTDDQNSAFQVCPPLSCRAMLYY